MNVIQAVNIGAPILEHAPVRIVKVLFDARKIEDGGIGMYIRNLLSGLRTTASIEITAIVKPGEESVALAAGADKALPCSVPLYSRAELFSLSKLFKFSEYDVFHTPHFVLPYGISIPTVVTIHDIIQITHPEKFFYPYIAKMLLRSALKRATKVLTVSESTKRQLLSLSPNSEQKIEVIPNAVDPQFYLIDKASPPSVGGDFLLSIFSNTKPHKGFEDLLAAFKIFKDKTNSPSKLVLAGLGIEGKTLPTNLQHPDIVCIGAVTQSQLKYLLRYAKALVVPSKAEGFCLPVIEAQACGTSVIARPAPAVLELMTTNDHVCKDFSVESLSNGLSDFLTKRAEAPDLLERGVPLSHMQRFDRAEVSHALASCYQTIVGASA
jgi:glycosyltransferase involved in cell wall biosynthesis